MEILVLEVVGNFETSGDLVCELKLASETDCVVEALCVEVVTAFEYATD